MADKPSPELIREAREWLFTDKRTTRHDEMLAQFGADIVRQCAEIAAVPRANATFVEQAILRKFGME